MATRGGHRDGAGRKVGSKNIASKAVKDLIDECIDMRVVINKLVELVHGVQVEAVDSEGGQEVYVTKPDVFAAKILMEYRYGKPQQSIKHEGDITEILINKNIVKSKKPNV